MLYGTPPNLLRLKWFSEAVWVHDPDGSKLHHTPEMANGLWSTSESHGHCVNWPVNKSASIEHNVYFAVAKWLEGRHMNIPFS